MEQLLRHKRTRLPSSLVEKNCLICKKVFYHPPFRKNRSTCSNHCKMVYVNQVRVFNKERNPRVNKHCLFCKDDFSVIYSRKDKAKYCSIKCFYESNKGKNNSSWNGGRFINKNGYVMIYSPNHPDSIKNGYILEHRLIVSKGLDRRLESWEVIHHKNGIKSDNRINNLELVTQPRNLMYKNIAHECPKCGHLFNS